MFSAFHTQVILGIFFFFLVGGKGKADYTVTVCVCVRDSSGLCV